MAKLAAISSSRAQASRALGDVADGQVDLDGGGEQLGESQRILRLGDDAADRALRGLPLSAGQAQERQPRLRLLPVDARLLETALGLLDGAPQAVDLPFLIARIGERAAIVGANAAVGAARLLDRLGPGAADLQELGAVNQAGPLKGHRPRLTLAPGGERGGPLARALDRVDALAAGDHSAIDEAGEDRRQPVRGHGQHALVEQRHAAIDLPQTDERPSLDGAAKRREISVSHPIADRRGLGGHGEGGVELARHLVAKGGGQQQVSLLGAFGRLALDDPLGPTEPGVGAPGLAQRHGAKADPERRPRRRPQRPFGEPDLVDPLRRLQKTLGVPRELRRPGQPIEILDRERGRLSSRRQARVGGGPVMPLVRFAPALEMSWGRLACRHRACSSLA